MNTSFIKFIVIAVLVVGSIFAFVGCERIDTLQGIVTGKQIGRAHV